MSVRTICKALAITLVILCPFAGRALSHQAAAAHAAAPPVSHPASALRVPSLTPRARNFYLLLWGVDGLDAKVAESGQMVRFSYTVLDPTKAATLNDKKNTPVLIDDTAHVRLEVPVLEKVGQLRQTRTPEPGKAYWMVFSNKGAVVKPGDRVSVVIGHFRVDGLYVR